MTNPRYYEDGKQISEVEATDARGVVRDGVSVRVRQQFLDGAGFLRDAAGPLRITDGSGSADGLHRPGWRVASGGSLDDMILRDIQRERIYRVISSDARATSAVHPAPDVSLRRNEPPLCANFGSCRLARMPYD